LGPDRPSIIRRNAVINLANIGRGHTGVLAALETLLTTADDELRPYVRWALDQLAATVR
jgi:hypothetical protein